MGQFSIIKIFFANMIFKYNIVQQKHPCNKKMVSIVCLTSHKPMTKLSINMVYMSFCKAQKAAMNYTMSSHDRFAKEKIIESFGRSKIDISPRLFVLRKPAFPLNKKQKNKEIHRNVQNFMLFLFKLSRMKYKGVTDFRSYPAVCPFFLFGLN